MNISKEPLDFLDIHYDSEHKIWKSVNYPYDDDLTNRTVGEAFLQSMRSLEPNKVLEYHYDVGKEKRVKDIYHESIVIAYNLQRLGIKAGDVVVLFSGYTQMTSVLTFGSILVGSIVNFFEVQLENEDIDAIMAILDPCVILYEQIFENKVFRSIKRSRPASLKYVYSIDGVGHTSITPNLLTGDTQISFDKFETVPIGDPQLTAAFLVLTSGSTGLPKVIQLSHSAVLNGMYIWWANPRNDAPLNSNTILFSLSPLRWISQVALLLQSAILGIKRVCANKAASGGYGLKILQETRPTHIFSVPSFFYEVLLTLHEDDCDSLSSLKYIQLGGEYPSKLIEVKTKRHCVNAKLFHSYGMSEVASSITNDEHISGGMLQPGFEMQILDEQLCPVGPNENGRICVRTPHPFLGYKSLDNGKYFLKNGFFLNGDFGYFDNKNILHLLSRYADLIKSSGMLLIPNIVESLAMEVLEVHMARLVGFRMTDGVFGCLFITLKENTKYSAEEICQMIREILQIKLSADEANLIRHIRKIEEFPLTTCGKIDRTVLKRWAAGIRNEKYNF